MNKKAFTLSELLIALSIIGIIAVLTIPNMIRNAFGSTNIAILQNVYNEFSTYVKQAMLEQKVQEYDDLDFTPVYPDDTEELVFLRKYFNIIKTCYDDYVGCFADEYRDISEGRVRTDFLARYNTFVLLKNGVSIGYTAPVIDNHGYYIDGELIIDTNGKDKPNTLGKDLFLLYVKNNGDVTGHSDSGVFETLDDLADDCTTFDGYFYTCFDYLQQNNWKMDY